jgi:predicted nuclease with TOPRIM domain
LIEQREVVAQLQPENTLMRSEVDRLTSQNAGLLIERENLQGGLVEQQEIGTQLQVENLALQTAIARLDDRNAGLEAKISDLENYLALLREDLQKH